MSVLQLQTAMARLLASAGFREQVRRDGGESLRAYQLTDAERAELMALLEGRLGVYAESVSAGKEEFLLANLGPSITTRLPEQPLRAALRRFIDRHPGAMLHPRDAGLAFVLRWLEEDLPGWPPAVTPPHARDVLRYERLRREVAAAQPRYARAPEEPVPGRLVRHAGWNADRFAYDVPAGTAAEVSWVFKRHLGSAEVTPCHPLLADLARSFDAPSPVEDAIAAAATRHQADERLGPDVAGAVREVVAELYAEGSLQPGPA